MLFHNSTDVCSSIVVLVTTRQLFFNSRSNGREDVSWHIFLISKIICDKFLICFFEFSCLRFAMFANLQFCFCVAIQLTRLLSLFQGMIHLANILIEKKV